MRTQFNSSLALLSLIFLGALAGSLNGCDWSDKPAERNGPPNIIVFFTDDHGFADLGITGLEPDVLTPNTDELAREGTLFTQGYVTAPQCSPSRAGLLTGIYQGRFGHETNLDGPMSTELVTIAERLSAVGYHTGMAGKWHLGIDQNNRDKFPGNVDETPYSAQGQGFDEFFEGERNVFRASHLANGTRVAAGTQVRDDRFRVDAATQWGKEFIRRNASRPFFLYLPYFAPHVPLEAPEADRALFSDVADEKRHTALAMLHAIDRGVGTIRSELAARGLTEDTLIIYAGDNGAPITPRAWNGSLNTPHTGEKGMLTDGGVRVPYIVTWPEHLPSGQVYTELTSTLDIAPTVLAVAGVTAPDELDGQNMLPALQDPALPPLRTALYWRFKTQAAIRTKDWKLITLGDGQRLLYNVRDGQPEGDNQIEAYPDIADDLEAQLTNWAQGLSPQGIPDSGISAADRTFYQFHGLIP